MASDQGWSRGIPTWSRTLGLGPPEQANTCPRNLKQLPVPKIGVRKERMRTGLSEASPGLVEGFEPHDRPRWRHQLGQGLVGQLSPREQVTVQEPALRPIPT